MQSSRPTSSTQDNVSGVHLHGGLDQDWIPSYGKIISHHLSINPVRMDTVVIHPSLDGHLGRLHVLAIGLCCYEHAGTCI